MGIEKHGKVEAVANCDLFEFLQNKCDYDVIYADPPWGGDSYRESSSVTLSFGSKTMIDFLDSACQHVKKFVLIKAPPNVDLE